MIDGDSSPGERAKDFAARVVAAAGGAALVVAVSPQTFLLTLAIARLEDCSKIAKENGLLITSGEIDRAISHIKDAIQPER